MTAAMTDADVAVRLGLLLLVAHFVGTWTFVPAGTRRRPRGEHAAVGS